MKPFATISILLALTAYGLAGCVKKEEPVAPPKVTPTPIAAHVNDDPNPTESQSIDAIRRSHPHSIQVCYDSVNDGFMIQYSVQADGEPKDEWMHGWWWIKNEKFWQAANGTWFTKQREDSDYSQIYPDVFNLPCKKTQ
jgi:hypothetical protein